MAQGTVDFDDLGYGDSEDAYGERASLLTENWPYNPTAYVLRTDERLAAMDETKATYQAMPLEDLEPELEKVRGELNRIFDHVAATAPEMISEYSSVRYMSDDVPQEVRALKDEMLTRRNFLEKEIKEKRRRVAEAKRREEYIADNRAKQDARDAEMRDLVQPQTTEQLQSILERTRGAEVSYQYRDSTTHGETKQLSELRELSKYAKEELDRRGVAIS